MFDYTSRDPVELTIHVGDIITVLNEDSSGWWKGKEGGREERRGGERRREEEGGEEGRERVKERRKVERKKRDTEAMREMIYIYIYIRRVKYLGILLFV